ncbi:MAG: hypothetical protein J5777_02905 [Clostridiales bacterium]|nr:hypothetical protein [Clostridiales bacterium]
MKRKSVVITISIFAVLAVIFGGIVIFTIRNYIKAFEWDIHEQVTERERDKLSYLALLPEAADDIDYYSVMGMRDPSYLITSHPYKSIDDLCDALPEGCGEGIRKALNKGEYKETEDTLNRMTKRYEVSPEDLPLIKEEDVKKDYYASALGAFRYYYVLAYEDGTYRFEMRVDEV